MDREKVLKEFDYIIDSFFPACTSDGYYLSVLEAVRELLKEQDDLGKELENAMELIHKKNERLEKQTAEIRQLRLALDIMNGNGIKVENVT